ncbi:MAG: FAD-binding oxidoreductase [Oscillochloris sp.]|nr:FAD-binding oxidoreductase [Oscillochloris sp.]
MIDTTAMGAYQLGDLTPTRIEQPAGCDELVAFLRQATRDGLAVVPWGGGTRQHIGNPPARYDVVLRTSGLNRIIEHTPADLTVTVETGTCLGDVQAALAEHGQWLPWDPPQSAKATIGGLLASGAVGSLRLGYGPPRDWTLGMRVVLGDGRLVRSGSKVVKNVAGYDSHKLHLGALGTLGVIAEITFKVAPLPPCRATLLASFTAPRAVMNALAQLREAPLQPIALTALNAVAEQAMPALHNFIADQPVHVVVAARFAGSPAAVERQLRAAAARCVEVGARTIDLNEHDDTPLWAAIADFNAPFDPNEIILRAGVPPTSISDLARLLEHVPPRHGWRSARMLLPGIGIGMARWHIPASMSTDLGAVFAELRASLAEYGGYVVAEHVPPQWRDHLDAWGSPPPTVSLMQSLRSRWDPAGIINPGRYLIP